MATTITDVHVFDGQRRSEALQVRMVEGAVAGIGSDLSVPRGDESIDGAGGTLLPGLIDSHVHLLPGSLRQSLTFGVTTVIDLFSKPATVHHAVAHADTSDAVADVRSSTVGATAPGGHPSIMYAPFPTLATPGEADAFVAARIADGAHLLKVFYDPPQAGSPFGWPSLGLNTVAALVDAAHSRGILAVAHVSTPAGASGAVSAGVDVLAHVPVDPLDEQLIVEIKTRQVAVIATLATIENAAGSHGAQLADDPELGPRLGTRWSEVLRASAERWRPPGMPEVTGALHNVERLAAHGVTILAGTDAPNPGTTHGASLHRELELLVLAGLSPAQALASATSLPADVFGLKQRGRVAVGTTADLVLVDGDPLRDITMTRRLRAVWRRGIACDLDGYVGSNEEAADMEALENQTRRVIAAARKLWPDAPTDGSSTEAGGSGSRLAVEPTPHEHSAATAMKERLRGDLRAAMVARDRVSTRVLRSAIAALDAAEAVTDLGAPATIGHSNDVSRRHLNRVQVTAVLANEIGERQQAIETYRGVREIDAAQTLEREVEILSRYLEPTQQSES